jgi:hypothetical protein
MIKDMGRTLRALKNATESPGGAGRSTEEEPQQTAEPRRALHDARKPVLQQ